MISVSRLLCDMHGPGDYLRYENHRNIGPVVVWNITRQCNLKCFHCYANSKPGITPREIDTRSGVEFISDLASLNVPAILFSGGEPLMRKDILKLAAFAHSKGIKTTLSTNGTLINEDLASDLKQQDFTEIGISLDGSQSTNDYFRGVKGAYDSALSGIKNCKKYGLRVSLRFTITLYNYQDIPAIMNLCEQEEIDRICFYHLVYTGRGTDLRNEDLNHHQKRHVLDTICEMTLDMYSRGHKKEVLTVGNHCDGIYIYFKLMESDPMRAEHAYELLHINGGNNSGIKIGAVDDEGNVHPDQFWWHYSLGNIRERKFSQIWMDLNEPLLRGLHNRKHLLKGRCKYCRYLSICNGNLRVRAEAVYGDIWAPDPACYLTDEEIGIL